MSKGICSDVRLSLAITGLSYLETHAFPRGAEQSRFPLVPLPHFCDLISPPAEPELRRLSPNTPHAEAHCFTLNRVLLSCHSSRFRVAQRRRQAGYRARYASVWIEATGRPIAAPVAPLPAPI
jgi:hypothetical protein